MSFQQHIFYSSCAVLKSIIFSFFPIISFGFFWFSADYYKNASQSNIILFVGSFSYFLLLRRIKYYYEFPVLDVSRTGSILPSFNYLGNIVPGNKLGQK